MLVICVSFIVCMLALYAIAAVSFLGGARKFQDMTDAAALSVAKKELKVSVALTPGIEAENFSTLAKQDGGTVDLLSYNRVIGQLLLVSLNAQSEQADGSMSALSHANQLWYAVQGSDQSIGKRLSNRLENAELAYEPFQNMVNLQSLTMIPGASPNFSSSQYKVSYMHAGDNTNVYLDESQLPPGADVGIGSLSKPKDLSGHRYIKGYTGINIGGVFNIQGTPVMPGCAPHLVSQRKFTEHLVSPTKDGFVPPNSFQSSARLDGKHPNLKFMACAMVGSLKQSFPASIPGGYIEIQKSGTETASVLELIDRAGVGAAPTIVPQLVQRAKEIQPELSEDDFIELLNNQKVEGSKLYISRNETSGQMEISSKAPQTFISGTSPDGTNKHFGTEQNGIAEFTPSSGYNNLLGLLTLRTNEKAPATNNDKAKEKEEQQRNKDRMKAIAEDLKAHAQAIKAQQEEKRSIAEALQAQQEEQRAQLQLNIAKTNERNAKEQMLKDEAALAKAEAHHNKTGEKKAEQLKRLAELAMQRAQKEMELALATKARAESEHRLSQINQNKALADLKVEQADKLLASKDLRLAAQAVKTASSEKTTTNTAQDKNVANGRRPAPMSLSVNVPGSSVQSQPDGMTSAANIILPQNEESKRIEDERASNDDSSRDHAPTAIVQNYKWD